MNYNNRIGKRKTFVSIKLEKILNALCFSKLISISFCLFAIPTPSKVNELRYSNSIKDSYSVTKLFVGAKPNHISQVV